MPHARPPGEVMNAASGEKTCSLRDRWAVREYSVREACWTSIRFGRKNTALLYSPESQTWEVNGPGLKPVIEGLWFSLRLYERFCFLALPSFPRLPAFLAWLPFIYTAMTLTSDLGNGRGVGGRLGSISSGRWLVWALKRKYLELHGEVEKYNGAAKGSSLGTRDNSGKVGQVLVEPNNSGILWKARDPH